MVSHVLFRHIEHTGVSGTTGPAAVHRHRQMTTGEAGCGGKSTHCVGSSQSGMLT